MSLKKIEVKIQTLTETKYAFFDRNISFSRLLGYIEDMYDIHEIFIRLFKSDGTLPLNNSRPVFDEGTKKTSVLVFFSLGNRDKELLEAFSYDFCRNITGWWYVWRRDIEIDGVIYKCWNEVAPFEQWGCN